LAVGLDAWRAEKFPIPRANPVFPATFHAGVIQYTPSAGKDEGSRAKDEKGKVLPTTFVKDAASETMVSFFFP
jgi:hypothetical protein